MEEKNLPGLSIHISEGCLIVPIQGEIDDERILEIQKQILKGVEDTEVKGVVIDVSGVRIIEPYHAHIIDNTAKMIYLLGARTVLTGMRPGVAISLTDSNFDFKEIYGIAGTFEEGVKKLQPVLGLDKNLEEFEEDFEEIDSEGEVVIEEEIETDRYEAPDLEEDEFVAGEEEKDGE